MRCRKLRHLYQRGTVRLERLKTLPLGHHSSGGLGRKWVYRVKVSLEGALSHAESRRNIIFRGVIRRRQFRMNMPELADFGNSSRSATFCELNQSHLCRYCFGCDVDVRASEIQKAHISVRYGSTRSFSTPACAATAKFHFIA